MRASISGVLIINYAVFVVYRTYFKELQYFPVVFLPETFVCHLRGRD